MQFPHLTNIIELWHPLILVIMGCKEVFISLVKKENKMKLEINNKTSNFISLSQKSYNENEYVKLGT